MQNVYKNEEKWACYDELSRQSSALSRLYNIIALYKRATKRTNGKAAFGSCDILR